MKPSIAAAFCLILLGAIAAAPAMAQKPAAKAAKKSAKIVVARVEGKPIYRYEVVRAFQSLPPNFRKRGLPAVYEEVLETLIKRKMMTIYGRREKYHKNAEVRRRLKVAEDQIIREVYLDKLIRKYLTEDRIRAHYDEFVRRNPPADVVRARHVLLSSEDKAKSITKQALGGKDFAELAKANSEGPSAPRGGDLGYFAKGEMVKPFSDAAFKLKKGAITKKPVKTKFGWHIIKVEDRRKRKVPPYKKIKSRMRQEVWAKLGENFLQQYRSQAKVERFAFDGKKKLPKMPVSTAVTPPKPGKK
ncbi:MAG: peptidylprolyl isomerase [Alphaproteobacteria bacterium]|nr:peptidylprolyl isomerase [Alphaproteobacteria bacterium]